MNISLEEQIEYMRASIAEAKLRNATYQHGVREAILTTLEAMRMRRIEKESK